MEDLRTFKKMAISLSRNQQKEKEEMGKLKDINHYSQKLPVSTQALPPTKIVNLNPTTGGVSQKWQREPLVFSTDPAVQTRAPALRVWVESYNATKPAYFTKFNIKLNLPHYSDQEYSDLIAGLDSAWTRAETDYLLEQLELFEGNFLVVADRWDRERFGERTIEDLKERALSVFRVLAEAQGLREHQALRGIVYDKQTEVFRKFKTEKFAARTEQAHRQEELLLSELKNLELLIKKKEKESRDFQRLMELSREERVELVGGVELGEGGPEEANLPTQMPFAYNRGGFLRGPIPNLPPLTNKKIDLALAQLEIPDNLYATEANIRLLEELKVALVKVFSLSLALSQKTDELAALKEAHNPLQGNTQTRGENTRLIDKPVLGLGKRLKEE